MSPPSDTLLFIEEFSHRVINDYTRSIAMLRLATRDIDDPYVQVVMQKAVQILQSRAEAHRALQPPLATDEQDIGEYLQTVCMAVSRASLADAGIQLTLCPCSLELRVDICWRLGLVVAELVNNAARHGLEWAAGEIRVDMEACQTELRCIVTDSGRRTESLTMGRGSRIVSALVGDLGGHVEWSLHGRAVNAIVRLPIRSETTPQPAP